MKMVGLRFLLTYGSFMIVVVTEQEAGNYLDGWARGKLPNVIGGTSQYGVWAVDIKSVVGFHTVPLEALMQQQGAQQPIPPSVMDGRVVPSSPLVVSGIRVY